MAISKQKLLSILNAGFPEAKITIVDLAGDQDHYSLEISSKVFEGMPLIKQHRMVKAVLSEVLSAELHAITIKTMVG